MARLKENYLGKQAKLIGDTGEYVTPAGQRVSIGKELRAAVAGTRSHPDGEAPATPVTGRYETRVEVRNETTLAASRRLIADGLRPVALNFASSTRPGGIFLRGGGSQEEELARSTALYACIHNHPVYERNRLRPNALNTDYAIYSPDVPVFRGDDRALLDEPYRVGIITCAAVNAKHVEYRQREEILPAMALRIEKVLAVGALYGHDSIVLGAWGCGAFRNDPREIAGLFEAALSGSFRGVYTRVVFAVLTSKTRQWVFDAFDQAFRTDRADFGS